MTKGIFIPIDGQESQVEAIKTALGESGLTFTELQPSKPGVKPLPRLPNGQISNVFVANGTKYTFISPINGIGINRFTVMNQLLIPFQNGKRSFEAMQQYWLDVQEEVGYIAPGSDPLAAMKRTKIFIIEKIQEYIHALGDISKERYDLSMYICAVFIIREGEDVKRFDFSEAESKIEDWIEEGYIPEDFFGIASSLLKSYSAKFEARKKALEEQYKLEQMFGSFKSINKGD